MVKMNSVNFDKFYYWLWRLNDQKEFEKGNSSSLDFLYLQFELFFFSSCVSPLLSWSVIEPILQGAVWGDLQLQLGVNGCIQPCLKDGFYSISLSLIMYSSL